MGLHYLIMIMLTISMKEENRNLTDNERFYIQDQRI